MSDNENKCAKNMLLQLIEHGDNAVLQEFFKKISTVDENMQKQIVAQKKAYEELERKLQETQQLCDNCKIAVEENKNFATQNCYEAKIVCDFF